MDKTDDTSKAASLLKEAEKKYKGGFLNFLTPKADRARAASQLLHQAANIYKLANNWPNAANAYLRYAEIEKEADLSSESLVENYLEAASIQRKFSTEAAIQTMELAVGVLCSEKKWAQAAKVKEEIGEIYEAGKKDLAAVKSYGEAVAFYNIEGDKKHKGVIQNLLLKIAEMKVFADFSQAHILEAIEIYEGIFMRHLKEKPIDSFVRDLFFRIALLRLADDDTVGAVDSLEKHSELDPDFRTSRESKFVRDLVQTFQEQSTQKFQDICREFDKETLLDPWKIAVLLQAKSRVEPEYRGYL